MTKVNSFKQGAFLLLALVGLINLSYAQSRCGGHNTTPTGCTGFKTYTQNAWGSNSCSNSSSTPVLPQVASKKESMQSERKQAVELDEAVIKK